MLRIFAFIVLVAVYLFVFRKRWTKVRLLIKDEPVGEAKQVGGSTSELLSFEDWRDRFQMAFYGLVERLNGGESQAEQSAAEALNSLRVGGNEALVKKTYNLACELLETGELQSILVKLDDVTIYVLLFPGLHDQPIMLKRYRPFSGGWVNHIQKVRQMLPTERQDVAMVSLAIFLSPDLREGTMHLAFRDNNMRLLPAQLLDSSEITSTQISLFESRQVI